MSSIEIRFHEAIQRYLAQDKKYEQRAPMAEGPVFQFLEELRTRDEDPNEILNEQADAAEREIRAFRDVRDQFTSSLNTVVMKRNQMLGSGAVRDLSEAFDLGPPPPADASALEVAQHELNNLRRMRERMATAHLEVERAIGEATEKSISALDAASALIGIRLATLDTFRESHLLSTYDQLCDKLSGAVVEELRDILTEEMLKHVAEYLLVHGLDLGAAFVPGATFGIRIAYGFMAFTKTPQPHKIIGGGDLLFELRKLLSREHKVLDTFKQDLDRTFDQLTAIENTYKTRPAP
ncbi:hypothetical protein CI15_33895 [Paraburkholderia monticola]|uniref:Uncharacterized protein n=1 Tax=Paraburkholderia monticola TaxID=1399968 RepID=A0A149PBW3_9BURK|nr:hypothetical protein [Paraburkholderia monticola]KXU82517.1 hypothetical protein CI15_33895 [Paraburkholderia monticola]